MFPAIFEPKETYHLPEFILVIGSQVPIFPKKATLFRVYPTTYLEKLGPKKSSYHTEYIK